MTHKLKQKLKNTALITLLRLKQYQPSESIIIFSEARGGSTWLMEMLAKLLKANINWEPLHVTHGVVPKEFNFGWRPFLPKHEEEAKYKLLFNNIHSYKVHTPWTRRMLSLKQLNSNKYVLTKYVRANMLVPYLLTQFEFRYTPIFLLRHPIDTCLSHLKAFKNESQFEKAYQIPKCINNERFIEHHTFLKTLKTPLERHVANWCLNNCETINQLKTLPIQIVYYSDLLLQPQETLVSIVEKLGITVPSTRFDTLDFKKPSVSATKSDFHKSIENQLAKNIQKLDLETKNSIQRIFDYFNLSLYSADDPLPNKRVLED